MASWCLVFYILCPYQVMNFDKLLVDTDKMITIAPPEHQTWLIRSGSVMLERPVEANLVVWLDADNPHQPYRDPQTGEMRGCMHCVTLLVEPASQRTFFRLVRGQPLVIRWPDHLMIALTPTHGGLPHPVEAYVRVVVVPVTR